MSSAAGAVEDVMSATDRDRRSSSMTSSKTATDDDYHSADDNNGHAFEPLMSTNTTTITAGNRTLRPNSILKGSSQHKRSCSTGQQITLPFDSNDSTQQKLLNNTCNCRTKSVQILTPSQEKDEQDLWPNADTDAKRLSGDHNESRDFYTKYCAKCDKILTNIGFDYNNKHNMNKTSDENKCLSNKCYYCSDCDIYDNNTCATGAATACNGTGGSASAAAAAADGHTCSQYQCHRHQYNNSDNLSQYSLHMEKDFRYYFQHPYARLFVAYFVVFCNFLIFAEDPLSHSLMECSIPVLGNVISFVATKYPLDPFWIGVKVCSWLTAIVVGLVFGKYVLHHQLLRQVLRLKMFRDECGTWMIMFATAFISCFFFSIGYNCLLVWAHPAADKLIINSYMGMTYANFMKVAACGTWCGDFFTAWMITDMMLQDNLYPGWARRLRSFWHRHTTTRILVFWTGALVIAALVITLIVTDKINWDNLNKDLIASTELSRAFLASSILVMDLLIVMQDWDFPHFVCDLNIKLPGLVQ
ncbi:unnamed protein product, partial [Medioppia subpectinata]